MIRFITRTWSTISLHSFLRLNLFLGSFVQCLYSSSLSCGKKELDRPFPFEWHSKILLWAERLHCSVGRRYVRLRWLVCVIFRTFHVNNWLNILIQNQLSVYVINVVALTCNFKISFIYVQCVLTDLVWKI